MITTNDQRKAILAQKSGKKIFSSGFIGTKNFVDPEFKKVFAISPMEKDVEQYINILRQSGYDPRVLQNLFQHQITVKYPDPNQWSQIVSIAMNKIQSPREKQMLQELMKRGNLMAIKPKYKGDKLDIRIDLMNIQ